MEFYYDLKKIAQEIRKFAYKSISRRIAGRGSFRVQLKGLFVEIDVLLTLPVTLPTATQTHPIPPNSTQLCAVW